MKYIENEKIFFTDSDYIDYKKYSSWINHFDRMKYLTSTKYPKTETELREYVENFKNTHDKLIFAIFTKKEEYIGNISISKIDWINRWCEIGIIIGESNFSSKGFAKSSVELLSNHIFNQLNLHKIVVGVQEKNKASLQLFKRLNFKKEGVLRQQFFVDGDYINEIRLGLIKKENNETMH